MLDIIQTTIGLLIVIAAFFKAVSMLTARFDEITAELRLLRQSVTEVKETVTKVEYTYVTEELCEQRRKGIGQSCQNKADSE